MRPRLETDHGSGWQHWRCPGSHGMWLVREEPLERGWRLALEPGQAPWTVAAPRPLCLFCGQDLVRVLDPAALARAERSALP